MVPHAHFATRAVDLSGGAVLSGAHPGAAVPPRPWTWLDQQHGADVVVVTEPGEHAGAPADAAVTAAVGAALVVRTADCAPVALLAAEGVGIAHAGWRGLTLGVLEAAVDALGRLGATTIRAVVGACITPARYEFGPRELELVAARYGDEVRHRTGDGRPALDLPTAVTVALRHSGVEEVELLGACTASDPSRWFSHRARSDRGRQGSFAWLTADTTGDRTGVETGVETGDKTGVEAGAPDAGPAVAGWVDTGWVDTGWVDTGWSTAG